MGRARTVTEGREAEKRRWMAVWKLILVANRARRGWKRIPPEQRRRIMETAGRGVRTHGPVVARRIGTVVKSARKAR